MATKIQRIKAYNKMLSRSAFVPIKSSVLLVVTLSSTSCLVGPNYVKPKVQIPSEFKETKVIDSKWSAISPKDEVDRGAWWTVFNDPLLNKLEDQLNRTNQNIIQAEANYRQALAVVDEARAGLFPTLTGAASLFRQKQGGGTSTLISTSGGDTSSSVVTTNNTLARSPTRTYYSTLLYATWEPDLWGLVRRTIEANVSAAQANAALVAVTRLSAQSTLAQAYFELRTVDLNQNLLEATVTTNKRIVQFAKHQYVAGVGTKQALIQAQVQLENAQAQALNNGITRGQYEHAIAVLTGHPPADLSLKPKLYRFTVPKIPVTIPSLWLERRPDVAQSERLVQSMSARIGVATAAFYPNLSLSSNGSATANSIHRLIHTPALGWSVGGQLAETILEGGLRRATVNAANQAYLAQVAAYKQTVLSAFQDVEDNLLSLRLLTEQYKVQKQAALHTEQELKLTTNQYKAGTVAYATVLTAQLSAYNARIMANDVQGLQMTSAVGLIKAMGGGWNK